MLGFARDHGVTAVLTNAVRYADRDQAVTADVLDASRRLVALDLRHVDRPNAEGHLKSGPQMAEVAAEVSRLAGTGAGSGTGSGRAASDVLLDATRVLARAMRPRPVRRPRPGLGVPARAGRSSTRPPARRRAGGGAGVAAAALRGRARPPVRSGSRSAGPGPARRRARRHRPARLRHVLPHRRRRRRPHPRDAGPGRCPRLGRRQPGQLPARHLRGRPARARAADGAVPLAAARRRCPTSTSTSSPPGAPRSTSGSSSASAASGARASR